MNAPSGRLLCPLLRPHAGMERRRAAPRARVPLSGIPGSATPRRACAMRGHALITLCVAGHKRLFDCATDLLPRPSPARCRCIAHPAAGQMPCPPCAPRTGRRWWRSAAWLLGALICFIIRAVPLPSASLFETQAAHVGPLHVRRVARRLWQELNGLDDLDRDRAAQAPPFRQGYLRLVDGLPGPMCASPAASPAAPCLLPKPRGYDDGAQL